MTAKPNMTQVMNDRASELLGEHPPIEFRKSPKRGWFMAEYFLGQNEVSALDGLAALAATPAEKACYEAIEIQTVLMRPYRSLPLDVRPVPMYIGTDAKYVWIKVDWRGLTPDLDSLSGTVGRPVVLKGEWLRAER